MRESEVMKLPELKVATKDIEIEFEFEKFKYEKNAKMDSRLHNIEEKFKEVENILGNNEEQLAKYNRDIDRLTNHSDGIDYMVAVGSGVLTAIIDSIWVGEFNFERGKEWGDEKVNSFVIKVAKWTGYEGDSLEGAIRSLENKYGLASDSNTSDFGGSLQHHLRDFAHHPTPVGLVFSMLTQFTGNAYGTNKEGKFIVVKVKNDKFIGDHLAQKFLYGSIYWFFHMVSDMAGSSNSPGAGTGLPGPLLSLLKELSVLPFFKNLKSGDISFSEWLSKLFNGTELGERDENGKIINPLRFDLRAEIGVAYELGRQAIPVIINECVVRGFYFIRHFHAQLKEKQIGSMKELSRLNLKKVLPFNNRTIVRMLTISTGTFTAIDLCDAAVRGAVKSKGNPAMFLGNFILRVNFVGLGRFAIAIGTDFVMDVKQKNVRDKKIALLNEQLHYLNAKVYYKQGAMWVTAEKTEKTIDEAIQMMETSVEFYIKTFEENKQSLRNIGTYKKGIDEKNPKLIDDLLNEIHWGKSYE